TPNGDNVLATVTVEDPEPEDTVEPVISLNGDNPMELEVGETYDEPGATAEDDVDGDVSDAIEVSGDVDTSTVGKYEVVYTVSDAAGNEATETRTVNVVEADGNGEGDEDTEAPILTLNGDNPMELEVGSTYDEPGATAEDNVDGDVTEDIEITGEVDTSITSEYETNIVLSDAEGNEEKATRVVNVKEAEGNGKDDEEEDTVAPVISLNGDNPMELEVGSTYDEPGATAEDNVDGDVSDAIEVSGDVDTSTVGEYEVVYTVSDEAGNEATATRIVNIIEAPGQEPGD